MANELATRIRSLTTEKINFKDDDAEAVIDGIATAALKLDDAADLFTGLAGEDTDQEEIALALVDLADLFDDVNLNPDQRAKLDSAVNGLLKTGTEEQKQAARDLFTATLDFGIGAKASNEFFDALLATDPNQ